LDPEQAAGDNFFQRLFCCLQKKNKQLKREIHLTGTKAHLSFPEALGEASSVGFQVFFVIRCYNRPVIRQDYSFLNPKNLIHIGQ